jgi:hypothetical protein
MTVLLSLYRLGQPNTTGPIAVLLSLDWMGQPMVVLLNE